MNTRIIIIRVILLATLSMLIALTIMPLGGRSDTKAFSIPGLPRPIAKQPVVITSAGQNTDTYIIRDIANQLMIGSFFMPQAKDADLRDMNTIVFVVGYSSMGTKLQGINYEDEKKRIKQLVEKAKENNMTVITVVISGAKSNNNRTDELLKMICSNTDYIIGIQGSSKESIIAELAKNGDIPLTLVNEVNDISEPFASAFR